MREARIEKLLKIATEKRGGLCLKFTSPGNKGVPDRVILFGNNVVAFVELKSPGKKLAPLQQYWKDKLNEKGCLYFKIDGPEQIEEVLDEIQGT